MGTPLAGHNALVTGGGSGIGLACAKAFARDGAAVTLMGRNAEKLERAAAEIAAAGGRAQIVAGDVGIEADVANAVAVAQRAGPLTIAVANAGTGAIGPIVVTGAEVWDTIMKTNLTGTFYTFKHAGAAIAQAGGGSMCAISSIAGARTHRFMGTVLRQQSRHRHAGAQYRRRNGCGEGSRQQRAAGTRGHGDSCRDCSQRNRSTRIT
jgi:NAD(P)-dependent dehydrogenase (short-subunit alcohol dehydrogenase family)